MSFAWIRSLIGESLVPLIVGYAAWTTQGWHKDKIIAELKQDRAETSFKAARQLIMATARIRALELKAKADIAERSSQLKSENENAQQIRNRRLAGIRSGAIRLSIPTAACAEQSRAEYSATTAGSRNETRSELNAATASTLETIAGTGDDAIRQLNACIDIYNDIRKVRNVQAR